MPPATTQGPPRPLLPRPRLPHPVLQAVHCEERCWTLSTSGPVPVAHLDDGEKRPDRDTGGPRSPERRSRWWTHAGLTWARRTTVRGRQPRCPAAVPAARLDDLLDRTQDVHGACRHGPVGAKTRRSMEAAPSCSPEPRPRPCVRGPPLQ